jgi:hypothetical protein
MLDSRFDAKAFVNYLAPTGVRLLGGDFKKRKVGAVLKRLYPRDQTQAIASP